MSYEPVELHLRDFASIDAPISGVLVKIFDATGVTAFTELETGLDGVAACVLPAPATYQVRCFKRQVAFRQPSLIDVREAAGNAFTIRGEPFLPPTSTDPRLCVVSGYFRQPNGTPAASVDLHFIAKFKPLLLDGDALLTERIRIRTDKRGFAQATLIRTAEYDVTVEGIEDFQIAIYVPDRAAANLPDLLFPVVEAISFDLPSPYSVLVGQELTLRPTITASSGKVLDGTALEDVFWCSSDPNVLGVLLTPTTLVLRGISPGQAEVRAQRSDRAIPRIPNTPISGIPLTVTVT